MKFKLGAPLIIFVAALLLGGLGTLVAMTQGVDVGLRSSINGQLRDIKQFDAELNLNVLRSRDELNKNYDILAGLLHSLVAAEDSLDSLLQQANMPSLAEPAAALKVAVERKADLVESFKTQNSILRNSMRFLPVAMLQLEDQIGQARNGSADAQLSAIQEASNRLMASILRFSLGADQSAGESLQDALDKLDALHAANSNRQLAEHISLVLTHARTIQQQRTVEFAILTEIVNLPTAQRADELVTVFETDFESLVAAREQWRLGLIAYSVVLLALLAFVASRLVMSYRSLNRANASLATANETLEIRVDERTRDLGQALGKLKESQAQLVQAEKMASLGQMVAGVAHEINTPLAYINNSLQVAHGRMADIESLVRESTEAVRLLADESATPEMVHEQFTKLDEITSAFVEMDAIHELETLLKDGLHGIEHISEIVLNLKDFSRMDRASVDDFNINDGVRSTLKIARNMVKKRDISLVLGELPRIRCSPSKINQVLLNLISNACHATSDQGGKISIVTRAEGEGVLIEVIDNGTGIPPEILNNIFDPFFTTKKVGEGSGLGLSIVSKIVEEHRGRISVASRIGVGAKFSVYLPTTCDHSATPTTDETRALAA